MRNLKKKFKLIAPHIGLLIILMVYIVAGALIFMRLEKDELLTSVSYAKTKVKKEKEAFIDELQNILYSKNGSRLNAEEAMETFFKNLHKVYKSKGGYGQYAYKSSKAERWTFYNSFFFSATTLMSVGYGAQAPKTFYGKIFCMIFITFGLPLVVVIMADVAKFIANFILLSYGKWVNVKNVLGEKLLFWKKKNHHRVEDYSKLKPEKKQSSERIEDFFWSNLGNVAFIHVPASLMFIIILLYVTIGTFIFAPVEKWTFLEGFYFSTISILAVGLGDFTPKNQHYVYFVLLYIGVGLLLATTCIELVGIQYLNKIHNFGRRLQQRDPKFWLKWLRDRRWKMLKRNAMSNILRTVSIFNRMKLAAPVEEPTESLNNNSLESNQDNTSQDPPSEPQNFKADSISVFSITLKWDPPATGSTEDLHYLLSYRLRRAPRKTAITVVARLKECSFEVTCLRSFTLYHFTLAAVNKFGRSDPVDMQEYTGIYCNYSKTHKLVTAFVCSFDKEPSTVPLNLRATNITESSITISWDSPVKNKDGERYTVFYTSVLDLPKEKWCKAVVRSTTTYTARYLAPGTRYTFAVSANHNGVFAIFSRSLEVLTKCVSNNIFDIFM